MPNDYTYVPLSWQIAPWRDTSRILLLTGAAGGGKSRLAAEKIHAYLLKYPGATGIMGRKDKTAAAKSVVPFMLYTVMGTTQWGEFHKSDGLFQYANGSQLWVVGLRDEGQRESLRSIGKDGSVDIAWLEEANKLTEADDSEITARMRGTKGGFRQKIYTTNPDSPDHWIKKKLIDGKQAAVYYSRPEENPYNPPDYIEGLKQLTGIFGDRLWRGLWVQAEGAIYTEFNSEVHVLDKRISCPVGGRYFVSVDFGFTNPFSASLWRVTNDGVIYQVNQVYKTKQIVEDHAQSIKRMLHHNDLATNNIEAWICDHDAEDRATLERHLQIETKPAFKAILPGINAVKTRFAKNTLFLNHNAVLSPDGDLEREYKPLSTAEEVPGYAWSDKKQDTPIGDYDHGLDEMRYLVAHVDKISHKTVSVGTKATISNYVSGKTTRQPESHFKQRS